MQKLKLFLLSTLLCLSVVNLKTFACTDIRVTAKDGTILIARSMEFGADMQSNVRTSTRNRSFAMVAPDGKPGLSWKAKYGYVYFDAMQQDVATDGMNEEGLSVEDLYLPNLAQYQTVQAGQDNQALPYLHFGDWVLSNFKTVDEVRNAIPLITVFAQTVPGMGDMIFPLHFSIFDATGKGIVVEYVDGKVNIYDHLGVLTNSPTYPWHLTNLQNYLHLAPTNPPSVVSGGITFIANGQGYGMVGLPGDISPPSRFVKVATLMHVAIPANDAAGAINLAEHVINNVDIPLGLAREPGNGNPTNETTQWVVFKDLTHKILYYRTYTDMSLHAVPLAKLNFAENAPRVKMAIAGKATVQDMTGELLKTAKMG